MTDEPLRLWTIGHSNQTLVKFVGLLEEHSIKILADIRRFPTSRKFPYFNGENLSVSLAEIGIGYQWLQDLGGRRKAAEEITGDNEAWQNKSFRNYADYMQTAEFQSAFEELKRFAATGRTAIMCSESVYWRCHRRLVSDYFLASGGQVEHIFPDGRTRRHTLTDTAVVRSENPVRIDYPGEP